MLSRLGLKFHLLGTELNFHLLQPIYAGIDSFLNQIVGQILAVVDYIYTICVL